VGPLRRAGRRRSRAPEGASLSHILVALLLSLAAGCTGLPRGPVSASPCSASEASYECQVERYQNVNAD
jgi:hypothetical protein